MYNTIHVNCIKMDRSLLACARARIRRSSPVRRRLSDQSRLLSLRSGDLGGCEPRDDPASMIKFPIMLQSGIIIRRDRFLVNRLFEILRATHAWRSHAAELSGKLRALRATYIREHAWPAGDQVDLSVGFMFAQRCVGGKLRRKEDSHRATSESALPRDERSR